MSQTARLPTLKGQVVTCLLFCASAVAITLAFQSPPAFSAWRVGLLVSQQLIVALLFACLVATGLVVVLQVPRLRKAASRIVPRSLNGLEMSGARAVVVALSAGVGEELLFRAALQPLFGLWLASAAFALAHIRTATLAGSVFMKVFYIANVFAVGVGLGLVFQHLGLLTVMLCHAVIDLAALLSLHVIQSASRAPAAT